MHFLQTVLEYGYLHQVESIHLQEGSPPLYYRGGKLEKVSDLQVEPGQLNEFLDQDGKLFLLEGLGTFRVQIAKTPLGSTVRLSPMLQAPGLSDIGCDEELADLVFSEQGIVLVAGHPHSLVYDLWTALFDGLNILEHADLVVLDRMKYLHLHKNSMVSQRDHGTDFHSWAAAIDMAALSGCDGLAVSDLTAEGALESLLRAASGKRWILGLSVASQSKQVLTSLFHLLPSSRQLILERGLQNRLTYVVWATEEGIELYRPKDFWRSEILRSMDDLGPPIKRLEWPR